MELPSSLSMLSDRIHELEQVSFEDVQTANAGLPDVVLAVVMQMRTTPGRIIRAMVVYSDYRGISRIAVDWKSFGIEAGWRLPIVEGKILPLTLPGELGRGVVFSDLRVGSVVKKHSPL
jgi:hypothetical protein